MVEKLREELYQCIDRYGELDIRTINKSQELDKYIVESMGGLTVK